jgi:hypothetical protein
MAMDEHVIVLKVDEMDHKPFTLVTSVIVYSCKILQIQMDPLDGLCTILIISPKATTFDRTNLTKISAWVSIVSPMLLHLILP